MTRPRVWYNHGYSSVRDALCLIRAGGGGRVRLLASHGDAWAPVRAVADEALVEPHIDRRPPGGAGAYVDWCLDVCRTRGVDLFIPQTGRTAIAERAPEFTALGVDVLSTADPETMAVLDDKGRFYAAAAAASLPTPWSVEVDDAASFDDALAELAARGLAACVKPPVGVFGAGYWQLDDGPLFTQLMDPDSRLIRADVVRQALTEAPRGTARLLVMQHLPGTEWSVDALCQEGRTVAAIARRKHRVHQTLEVEGLALALARKAAAHFRLSGLVNIQLKSADLGEGAPHLLEINSRMSGGCLYTALSGLNLPWWTVALRLGLEQETAMPLPVGRDVAAVGDAVTVDAEPRAQWSDLVRTSVAR